MEENNNNSAAAAARCLAVFELLEAILLEVDMVALLTVCQRVNRYWHDVIRASVYLQRKLFFEPEIPSPSPSSSAVVVVSRMNPLLTCPFAFALCTYPTWNDNTLVQRPISHNVWPPASLTIRSQQFANIIPFPTIREIRNNLEAFGHERASWRRMLVRQPPAYALGPVGTCLFHRSTDTEFVHPAPPSTPEAAETEPLRMQGLLEKLLLMNGCRGNDLDENVAAESFYYASAFRVIWDPSWLDPETQLARYLRQRFCDDEEAHREGKDLAVVNIVIDLRESLPIDPNVLLLRRMVAGRLLPATASQSVPPTPSNT
ncbi:hypothetical protein F5Y17DRAFT_462194 [Xylariaceae sp. FL0594]|nr:hypothetical protein F5Y17DRAFT_462194 [Xylariaceae sp. FL0594]